MLIVWIVPHHGHAMLRLRKYGTRRNGESRRRFRFVSEPYPTILVESHRPTLGGTPDSTREPSRTVKWKVKSGNHRSRHIKRARSDRRAYDRCRDRTK